MMSKKELVKYYKRQIYLYQSKMDYDQLQRDNAFERLQYLEVGTEQYNKTMEWLIKRTNSFMKNLQSKMMYEGFLNLAKGRR